MKTISRIAASAMLGLCLSAGLTAAEKTKDGETMDYAEMMKVDHVMMHDGKMVIMKQGKTTPMDKEMTMTDGTKVMMDGSVTLKDGKKKMLKEGDIVTMDGKMAKYKNDKEEKK